MALDAVSIDQLLGTLFPYPAPAGFPTADHRTSWARLAALQRQHLLTPSDTLRHLIVAHLPALFDGTQKCLHLRDLHTCLFHFTVLSGVVCHVTCGFLLGPDCLPNFSGALCALAAAVRSSDSLEAWLAGLRLFAALPLSELRAVRGEVATRAHHAVASAATAVLLKARAKDTQEVENVTTGALFVLALAPPPLAEPPLWPAAVARALLHALPGPRPRDAPLRARAPAAALLPPGSVLMDALLGPAAVAAWDSAAVRGEVADACLDGAAPLAAAAGGADEGAALCGVAVLAWVLRVGGRALVEKGASLGGLLSALSGALRSPHGRVREAGYRAVRVVVDVTAESVGAPLGFAGAFTWAGDAATRARSEVLATLLPLLQLTDACPLVRAEAIVSYIYALRHLCATTGRVAHLRQLVSWVGGEEAAAPLAALLRSLVDSGSEGAAAVKPWVRAHVLALGCAPPVWEAPLQVAPGPEGAAPVVFSPGLFAPEELTGEANMGALDILERVRKKMQPDLVDLVGEMEAHLSAFSSENSPKRPRF
jgi:hypothetical protein